MLTKEAFAKTFFMKTESLYTKACRADYYLQQTHLKYEKDVLNPLLSGW